MSKFEQILVATDFSDCSRVALRLANQLAEASGADVYAVHVIDTLTENPLLDAHRLAVDAEGFVANLHSKSEELMTAMLEECGMTDSGVRQVHLTGSRPAEVLLSYARREQMDLIVCGTHGRRGFSRLLLGSVALSVAGSSDRPVLVARDGETASARNPVRRILVPVDLSRDSIVALRAAQSLALLFHAQLEIVHVLERFSIPVSLSKIKTLRELVPDIEDRVHAVVKRHVEELEGAYVPYQIHIREGDPALVILDLARELGCNLIVMSRRGHTASERFLLGGVAQKVLHTAPCSVYVEPGMDEPIR